MEKGKSQSNGPPGLTLEAMTPREPSSDQTEQVSLLMFEVGGHPFALAVEYTEGVVDCPRVSPLPSPPDGITGVASVRGRITLVIDLSLGAVAKAARRRLVLIKGEAQLGLLADHVEGVVRLAPKDLHTSVVRKQATTKHPIRQEPNFPWPTTAFLKSGDRLVPIINVERLAETW